MEISEGAELTIDATLAISKRAQIPTQGKDKCVRKLRKLFEQYRNLRKSRLKRTESSELKATLIKSDLNQLFDISLKDALSIMKNPEDKLFLKMIRQDPSSFSVSGVDQGLTDQENRTRVGREQEADLKAKHARNGHQATTAVASTSAVTENLCFCS